jgi:hypothetical protein
MEMNNPNSEIVELLEELREGFRQLQIRSKETGDDLSNVTANVYHTQINNYLKKLGISCPSPSDSSPIDTKPMGEVWIGKNENRSVIGATEEDVISDLSK